MYAVWTVWAAFNQLLKPKNPWALKLKPDDYWKYSMALSNVRGTVEGGKMGWKVKESREAER